MIFRAFEFAAETFLKNNLHILKIIKILYLNIPTPFLKIFEAFNFAIGSLFGNKFPIKPENGITIDLVTDLAA